MEATAIPRFCSRLHGWVRGGGWNERSRFGREGRKLKKGGGINGNWRRG